MIGVAELLIQRSECTFSMMSSAQQTAQTGWFAFKKSLGDLSFDHRFGSFSITFFQKSGKRLPPVDLVSLCESEFLSYRNGFTS